jgi:hypothetical protein
MEGMVHAGGSEAEAVFCARRAVCGVRLAVVGVFGVVLAEAGAELFLRGVWGSRGVEASGRALAR